MYGLHEQLREYFLPCPLFHSLTAEMATSLESRTVKDHFADICSSIPASGVTTFADELLQADLIHVDGHRAAIAIGTGLPSSNKISNMVSEVMTRVAGSQDKLAKFVSILESRNKELAENLTSAYPGLASCSDTEVYRSTAQTQCRTRWEQN